jgi:hypothetical protein
VSPSSREQVWETVQRLADEKGRVPDPPELVKAIGGVVSLHELVHLLWGLQKQGLITFREERKNAGVVGNTVNKPIRKIRLRKRAAKTKE